MIYEFKCSNENCGYHKDTLSIDVSISEYDDKVGALTCPLCNAKLQRVYSSFGLKTFNDGYKS